MAINTTNVDAGTDSPASARADILALITDYNIFTSYFNYPTTTATGATFRITTDNKFILGIFNPISTPSYSNSISPKLQVIGKNDDNSGVLISRYGNTGLPASLNIRKNRGTAATSFTALQSNDTIGIINFNGTDGTQDINSAGICALVAGTVATGKLPAGLLFFTTADGDTVAKTSFSIFNESAGLFTDNQYGTFNVNSRTGSPTLVLSTEASGSVANKKRAASGIYQANGDYFLRFDNDAGNAGVTAVSITRDANAGVATIDFYTGGQLGTTNTASNLTFRVTPTTIFTAGRQFLLGRTTAISTEYLLVNAGNSGSNVTMRVANTATTVNSYAELLLSTYTNTAAVTSASIRGLAEDTAGNVSIVFSTGVSGTVTTKLTLSSAGHLIFAADNTQNVGSASNRAAVIYAGTGTINTSDANEKTDIVPVTEFSQSLINVGKKLKTLMYMFRYIDSVNEKGANARYHFGTIAQQVQQAFIDEGLDGFTYGVLCEDSWYEGTVEEQKLDDEGHPLFTIDDGIGSDPDNPVKTPVMNTVTKISTEPVDGWVKKTRLGIRYTELFSLIIACL